jgi:histidine triad (HIT) family protein
MASGAMTERPCLLCLVAQGKIQAQKVLESDRIIAVMSTREPQARGHIVIFPKHHATALREMDPQDLGEVAVVARAIANAQGLENYNLLHNAGALAGQTIFHAHFHLIPKWSEQEGLLYTWKTDARFSQQEAYLKIKEALEAAR